MKFILFLIAIPVFIGGAFIGEFVASMTGSVFAGTISAILFGGGCAYLYEKIKGKLK